MSDDQDNSEQLTDLVSYLDSELDQTRMNEVELQLLNDPSMRTLADELERSWGLLDSLDEVSVDPQFTQKTMASVSSAAISERSATSKESHSVVGWASRAIHNPKIQSVVGWLIVGILCTFIGLVIGRMFQQNNVVEQDETILRNQDLLINYPSYSSVPGEDELRRLPIENSTPVSSEQSE